RVRSTGRCERGWEQELPGVLAALGGPTFAGRSSGVVEDADDLSFAGQFHTSLEVPAAEVEDAVNETAVGVDRARTYAKAVGRATGSLGVAVIVQRMLAPYAAGVAFTRDPITGQRDCV